MNKESVVVVSVVVRRHMTSMHTNSYRQRCVLNVSGKTGNRNSLNDKQRSEFSAHYLPTLQSTFLTLRKKPSFGKGKDNIQLL